MFVKVLPRHSGTFEGLLQYIFKEENPNHKLNHHFFNNVKGKSISEIALEFEQQAENRKVKRKDAVKFYHEVLSYNSKDREILTPEMVRDIGLKYIELRGLMGQMAGKVHFEKEHLHLHLLVNSVEVVTGKAFRLSRNELQDLKLNLQEYHKTRWPEIQFSFCEHGKNKEYLTDRAFHAKQKKHRDEIKNQILETVQSIFKESKSQQEFKDKLRDAGLNHYERKSIPTGIFIDDVKVRFTKLGISIEEIEHLTKEPVNIETTTNTNIEQKIKEKMKTKDFNRPLNTENVNYNIYDEFENPFDFESEKTLEEEALDWLQEIEEKPTITKDFFNEIFSEESNTEKKEIDLDFELG